MDKDRTPKKLIMTGNLSNLPPIVANFVENNYNHHRTAWFEEILETITQKFVNVLGSEFKPLILTCTRLGAKEALVSNLVAPFDVVWAPRNSNFENLIDIWGGNITLFSTYGWLGDYKSKKDIPKIVFIEHVSSSGQILDIAEISKRIKKINSKILIVVDLSVSFGVDKVDLRGANIDGVIIIPERGLMGVPGLSIVAINNNLLEAAKKGRNKMTEAPYLLDLIKSNDVWKIKHTTPYSPNISASIALRKSLEFIEANGGIDRNIDRHRIWASMIRKSLSANGIKPLLNKEINSTNAFTIFELPLDINVNSFVDALNTKKNILIERFSERNNAIKIGHTGYLDSELIHRFMKGFNEVLLSFKKEVKSQSISYEVIKRYLKGLDFVYTLADNTSKNNNDKNIFSIPADEFIELAIKKAKGSGSDAVVSKVESSARKLFHSSYNYDQDCLKDRVIGFIGTGNVVRYASKKCQKLGMKNIIVYSPSLAILKKNGVGGNDTNNHKTLEYWENRDIHVATSSKEVFMNAHTVILLPTMYNRMALQLFKKSPVYLNEKMIDRKLLREIKLNGKMDLLINSSARSELIDRKALSNALEEGWLVYCSDELPSSDDPLLKYDNAIFTGHVGGSGKLAQKKVAINTHKILGNVIRQMSHGRNLQLKVDSKYTINLVNNHLNKTMWRSKKILAMESSTSQHTLKEIRVLITDPFDVPTLDFESLEKLGVKIKVKDVSHQKPTNDLLKENIKKFRPHILMVRSRTKITKDIMNVVKVVPELSVIIRPGVGVDNIYNGMVVASELGIQIINEPFGNSFAIAEMTLHFILNGISKIMLTPGPTQFNQKVFEVTDKYYHPCTKEFTSNYKKLLKELGDWCNSRNDPVILSSSSTGFMEASISNLTSHGDNGLIISHGKFGDRFIEIVKAKGRIPICMKTEDSEWGKVFTPKEIDNFLKKYKLKHSGANSKISFLCFQQNETSTGVAYNQNQIKHIVRAARSYNSDIMIIVDAVSGMFATRLDFDKLDVDAMIFGSQKGLGVSSGLAYIILSQRAIEKMLKLAEYPKSFKKFCKDNSFGKYLNVFERKQKVLYLSVLRLMKNNYSGKFDDMTNIFHIMSTLKSLELMESEGGIEKILKRHKSLASLCRKEVSKMNLKLMSHAPYFSNSVTAVILPKGIKAWDLRKKLAKFYGISIAGAQADYWKENMVRIGHLGFVYKNDMVRFLRAFRILVTGLCKNNWKIKTN